MCCKSNLKLVRLIFNIVLFVSCISCHRIKTRHIFQLGVMINKVTGKNSFDFIGYGCWCGTGGFGEPLDKIDECCLQHDKCYFEIRTKQGCTPKSNDYTYNSQRGLTVCRDDNASCDYKTCNCDKNLAACFYKNLDLYDERKKSNLFNGLIGVHKILDACQCPPGKFLDKSSSECIQCPLGFYNDKPKQTSISACRKCPAGSYASFDRKICITCGPGYYIDTEGAYCDDYDNCNCKQCPDGYICPYISTVMPIKCQNGTKANLVRTQCTSTINNYNSTSCAICSNETQIPETNLTVTTNILTTNSACLKSFVYKWKFLYLTFILFFMF